MMTRREHKQRQKYFASIGTEPGHGKDAVENDDGLVLFCQECDLPQWLVDEDDFDSPVTCNNGHEGAKGITRKQMNARKKKQMQSPHYGSIPVR